MRPVYSETERVYRGFGISFVKRSGRWHVWASSSHFEANVFARAMTRTLAVIRAELAIDSLLDRPEGQ